MTLEKKLYFGIPKGNLNRPEKNRGNTKLLLEKAGWKLDDYEHRKEKPFPRIIKGDKEIKFIVAKPRLFPSFLYIGNLDIAIYGLDIQEEWCSAIWQEVALLRNEEEFSSYEKAFNGPQIYTILHKLLNETREGKSFIFPNEVCDLGYGKVDVCFAAEKIKITNFLNFLDIASDTLIFRDKNLVCVTEYPNLAFREFCRFFSSSKIKRMSVYTKRYHSDTLQLYLVLSGLHEYINDRKMKREISKRMDRIIDGPDEFIEKKINIFELPTTELSLKYFLADIMLDCVASGESLREHKLEKLGEPIIKNSTARLYTTSNLLSLPSYNKYQPQPYDELAPESGKLMEWRKQKIREVAEKLQDAARGLGWIK